MKKIFIFLAIITVIVGGIWFLKSKTKNGSDIENRQAVINARALAAQRAGVKDNEVTIISFRETNWSNGCLGLPPEKGQLCSMEPVSGYEVTLSAKGQEMIYRTDLGSGIRQEK